MTPPIQEAHAPAPAFRTAAGPQSVRTLSRPVLNDLVALTDVWVVLAVLWASRLATGALDPSVVLFGLVSVAFVLAPSRSRRGTLSVGALMDAGHIFRRVWLAYALASAVSITVGVGDLKALLAVAVLSAPLLLAGRAASHSVERALTASGSRARTLVIGAGDIAQRVIETLEGHDEYGLEVIGAADDDPKYAPAELGTRMVGSLEDVPEIVRSHGIQVVLVAFSAASQQGMVEVIRGAMTAGATVWVVPRFFELGAADSGGDHLWGLPVMRLQAPARSRPEWIMKRTFDFVAAAIGVIAMAPLLALLALLVLLEAGRPIFLKQTRVGLDGKPFELLKFRTMRVGG